VIKVLYSHTVTGSDAHAWLMLFIEMEAGHSLNFPSVRLARKAPTISDPHGFDTCYCDVMTTCHTPT